MDSQVKFNPDTLIDNFLINAYALENYFQIDILDELDSIAKKIEEANQDEPTRTTLPKPNPTRKEWKGI
jgi:hypothetical protein